jgi:GNAT superfamily N-acetyltransferase
MAEEKIIVLDNAFKVFQHIRGIAKLEAMHPEELAESFWEKLSDYLTHGSLGLIYIKDDKVVGETIGVPVSSLEDSCRDKIPGLYDSSTLYVSSFTVQSEYQGQGIGSKLVKSFIPQAKARGYSRLIGHAAEGSSLRINNSLGAKVLQRYPDYYGTGKNYYFYELIL